MSESTEILTIRAMAWERAKGELHAYMQTFWPSYAKNGKEIDNGFEKAAELIGSFIKDFENNCR